MLVRGDVHDVCMDRGHTTTMGGVDLLSGLLSSAGHSEWREFIREMDRNRTGLKQDN